MIFETILYKKLYFKTKSLEGTLSGGGRHIPCVLPGIHTLAFSIKIQSKKGEEYLNLLCNDMLFATDGMSLIKSSINRQIHSAKSPHVTFESLTVYHHIVSLPVVGVKTSKIDISYNVEIHTTAC